MILLGWNSQNNNPKVGVGQLDTLVKTLHAMDKSMRAGGEELMNTTSSFCSTFENEWIKSSLCQFQANSKAVQVDSNIIQCLISFSKGNFESLNKFMMSMTPLFKSRMDTLLSSYGSRNYKLNMEKFQTLIMMEGLKGPSFQKLKGSLAWITGSNNPASAHDEFGVGNGPSHSTYEALASCGVFVKVKGKQLRFKEVYDTLIRVMRNEEVSHLFFMVVLFNSEETRNIQNQYQYLLVKKLAEFKYLFGAENGDQALCSLKSLFTEYVTLSERFLKSLENNISQD